MGLLYLLGVTNINLLKYFNLPTKFSSVNHYTQSQGSQIIWFLVQCLAIKTRVNGSCVFLNSYLQMLRLVKDYVKKSCSGN